MCLESGFGLRDSETFPVWAPFPHALQFLPLSSLLSVTEEELKKLLPDCESIYV